MKPKIVVLRGRPASGKSTALENLRKKKEMKEWVILDFSGLKGNFDNLGAENRKEYSKIALFAILKDLMKTKRNIIFDEMSRDAIIKYVGKEIKKYGYNIVVFQFWVSTKKAKRRDKSRVSNPKHPHKKLLDIEGWHEYHDKNADPKGIFVDCDKLNKKEVVDFIVNRVK